MLKSRLQNVVYVRISKFLQKLNRYCKQINFTLTFITIQKQGKALPPSVKITVMKTPTA